MCVLKAKGLNDDLERLKKVFITYVHRRAMEFEGVSVKKEELVLKEEGRAERVDMKNPFCHQPVLCTNSLNHFLWPKRRFWVCRLSSKLAPSVTT